MTMAKRLGKWWAQRQMRQPTGELSRSAARPSVDVTDRRRMKESYFDTSNGIIFNLTQRPSCGVELLPPLTLGCAQPADSTLFFRGFRFARMALADVRTLTYGSRNKILHRKHNAPIIEMARNKPPPWPSRN